MFQVTWIGADDSVTTGPYGLNFYWSSDRPRLSYYSAGARVGEIHIGDASYKVTLLENDGDAIFDKAFDESGATVVGAKPTKPVWLMLDGDRFDVRGTFQFDGMNWLAHVSPDGSHISMAPTFKVVRPPQPEKQLPMLGAGGDAPEFEARMIGADGAETPFRLDDFEGKKIVVLDMWATWCGPCRAGLPHLAKLANKTKDQDVVVIALNSFDDQAAYQRFVESNNDELAGIHFARDPAGRESDASIAKRLFNVTAIPATYVIDKQGKIAAVVSGYQEGDHTLENALEKLGVKFD